MVEEQVQTQTLELDAAPFQVEVISDPDRFNSIGADWDNLVHRASIEHPFLSHTWFRTWWECFGKTKDLHIVTIRAAQQLVAAAPMMWVRTKVHGFAVDAITSIYNPHTPRFDFIIAAESARDIIYALIWRELSMAGSDMVVLHQVPEVSPTLTAIERLARNDEWFTGRWIASGSPYIRLGCSYAELFSRLKGSYRYNLRKRYERLRKIGPIDVEVITDRHMVNEAMKDGLRIEAAAWKGDQGTAILSDSDVTSFYMRLAEREADRGHLRLSFLRVGGKRISFNYVLHSQKNLYGVKIGYDPEYHTYSPGNMLLSLILQEACERGCNEYDFLGANDEWKFDWTNETRSHQWLFLFPNRWRPRLLHYLKFRVLPRMKPCISRFGRLSTQHTS